MADSTLSAIEKKVRRLTRSPSTAQLSQVDLREYINTFILYDIPESLRLFSLKTNFTFYTSPYIDTYETNTADLNDPLYNFKNKYITFGQPAYVDGYNALWSQSQSEFYGMYPFTNTVQNIATGNGVDTGFVNTLSAFPVARNKVTFTSIDANNNGLRLSDDGNGNLQGDGLGTIDYITGDYSLSFNTAPGAGKPVESHTYVYAAARPDSILYFDNKFVLRPIPDKVYKIDIEAHIRPTELLESTDSPELEQWWQYIAYGASKKVFEDRGAIEDVSRIMHEFNKQERLVLRRTIVQQSSQRAATIYSEGINKNFLSWSSGKDF